MVARFFTVVGLKPNMITYFGVFMMLLFVFSIRRNALISSIFLILNLVSDGLDGVLARYQKNSSVKGKFIDFLGDDVSFVLFILGLIYGGFINGLVAVIFVYLMSLSKVFRGIINYYSPLRFKVLAGFPHFFALFSYFLFFVFAILNVFYFNASSLLFSFFLLVDILFFYFEILKKSVNFQK